MNLAEELARRNRFGMKPGLEAIGGACSAFGNPERKLRGVIHVAGTNGKGAVSAILDSCLRAAGRSVGCYTSPHLVSISERFRLGGVPVGLSELPDFTADELAGLSGLTYFEFLTLIAFRFYADANPDHVILETGLGGRLDATSVCSPELTVITRIGLDHCDWLGDTVEKIAAEKSGILRPGVPVVLGANAPSVREVVLAKSREVGAPFHYAPDLVADDDVPPFLSLAGAFNRENAVTALAALKVLGAGDVRGCGHVSWPGRYQRVGNALVDGAHNPPAAAALANALREDGVRDRSLTMVCGFCGDKDVDAVIGRLAPLVRRAVAVRTQNPRSLAADDLAARLRGAGIDAVSSSSLSSTLAEAGWTMRESGPIEVLVCGSLFLAGEVLETMAAGRAAKLEIAEKLRTEGL